MVEPSDFFKDFILEDQISDRDLTTEEILYQKK